MLSFIAPELLCYLISHTSTFTALYHSSGFLSPAEGLHFSALVCLCVTSECTHLDATALRLQHG